MRKTIKNAQKQRKVNRKESRIVIAKMLGRESIPEAIPTIEELIKHPIIKSTTREMEKISEQTQKKAGIFG